MPDLFPFHSVLFLPRLLSPSPGAAAESLFLLSISLFLSFTLIPAMAKSSPLSQTQSPAISKQ